MTSKRTSLDPAVVELPLAETDFSETALRPYRVYKQGHSRKIAVPEQLVTDPDEQVRFHSRWIDDRLMDLRGEFLSTGCPSVPLSEGVEREERGIRAVCGPRNDRTATIPAPCDEQMFPLESEPMLVSGRYKDEPAYFKLIPEAYWRRIIEIVSAYFHLLGEVEP